MQQHRGALHALEMLLCLVLGAAGSGQGAGCMDRAVLTGTDLQLLLEEPLPLEWEAVVWRVAMRAEPRQRILTARKDKVVAANSSFSQRATFHREPPSLQIRAVTQADNGNYSAEFENSDGSTLTKCFNVSVWEPVGSPQLETRVVHQEQERCRLQLSCTVPETTAVSYSWSHDSEPVGNQSVLEVPEDVQPGFYVCNVSNPASWSTASIDTATACTQTGLFGAVPWWAVAVLLLLVVCIAGSTTYWCWRRKRRRKEHPAAPTPPAPPEHAEPSLTVYEEVGKARTGREPNGNSEAYAVGNTVYAVVQPKGQRPRSSQQPESCTIYSTVQHRMSVSVPCYGSGLFAAAEKLKSSSVLRTLVGPQSPGALGLPLGPLVGQQPPTPSLRTDPLSASQSPSFKRKKLDRALLSTAYMEVTAPLKCSYPPPQSSSTSPMDHHTS